MFSAEPVDYDRLEDYLRALSHARRLELLQILQSPHALGDIRITPGRDRAGPRPDRISSRQAVQRHLETLQEIGVVVASVPSDGRGKEFVVDRQRVFLILEELRRVATITAGTFVAVDSTVPAGGPDALDRRIEPGPKLLLVHGFVEGKAFPLRKSDVKAGSGWVIGRKADAHVCLDYDPFVSLVNSEIVPRGDGFALRDLGISRNGTWLNWRRIGPEPVDLRAGDVVGVGRTLLTFQAQ